MKTIIKLSLFLLIGLLTNCSEDDDEMNPSEGIRYTFIQFSEYQSVLENEGPQEIFIPFSRSAYSSGEIQLKLNIEEELNFQTIPEMIDGIITLQVNEGDQKVSFTLIPNNDDRVNGYQELTFIVHFLSETLRNSNNRNLIISLLDDELSGMPKSLELTSTFDIETHQYFYNSNKKISKTIINHNDSWSNWTSIFRYYYDNELNLTRKTLFFGDSEADASYNNDIIYIWENGRVIQTDYMVGNTKSFYTIYEYDEQNNVILKKEYDIVSSTEELLLYKTNYTYNQNNDLIENRTTIYYHPNDWWPEEGESTTIISYGEYTQFSNPFPMNEIIPGVFYQQNLPGIMTIQIDDNPLETYNYTYEFDSNGRLIKRIATEETAIFGYQ